MRDPEKAKLRAKRWYHNHKELAKERNDVIRKRHQQERAALKEPPPPDGYKRCSRCKDIHPATTEYFKLHKGKLYCHCRVCVKLDKQESHERNRDKDLARTRHWFEINHEHKKATDREYMEAHREEKRAYDKARNAANPEANRAKVRQWREDKPEHYKRNIRVSASRRKARELNAVGSFTQADIALQIKSQKGLCWWCGEPIGEDYHVDHRIPLAKGGTNNPNNLCIACPDCNRSKGAKLPHEFNGRLL